MKVQAGDAVRLSEKVLSLGIQEFYTSQRLVPIGIGLEAVQAVCDKMALGLRKVVQKFARTYKESPEGAKSKRLKELKDRLKNVVSSHEVVASEANPDSVEEVAQHLPDVKPKIDWVALSEKIALRKKQPAPDNAEAKSKDNLPRPVATPARNKYALPEHVLVSLQNVEVVKPFATSGDAADEAQPPAEPETGKKKKASTTSKAKKKKATKGGKAKKKAIGAEEEKNLALVPLEALSGSQYKAGNFNEARLKFISTARSEQKISHKEAQALWMMSPERADMLSGLSMAELKKRRFA